MSRTDAIEAVMELLVAGGWLASPDRATLVRSPADGGLIARRWPLVVLGVLGVLGPGALGQPLRKLGPASPAAQPAGQRTGHRVALAGQQHVAEQPADQQGQRDQQQAAGAGQIERQQHDHEQSSRDTV